MRLPREDFVRESLMSRDTQEELPLYRYPVIAERTRAASPLFYSVTLGGKGSLNLLQLIEPAKWMNSPFRQAFREGEAYLENVTQLSDYVLTIQLVGMVWVTRKCPGGFATDREFDGAILVRDPENHAVFATMPLRSYMVSVLGRDDCG